MNPIQSKIEQTAKEFLTYKAIVEEGEKQAKNDKEKVCLKAVEMQQEDIYNLYFDTFAPLGYLKKDMMQLKTKLYNQLELVKDVIDIPKEILDIVAEYNQPMMFAIIGDEKKLVNEEAYKQDKAKYIQGAIQIATMNNK
jgi:hypothetical protein